jgi:hypothetical protein
MCPHVLASTSLWGNRTANPHLMGLRDDNNNKGAELSKGLSLLQAYQQIELLLDTRQALASDNNSIPLYLSPRILEGSNRRIDTKGDID